ncbi:MAG: hypothetical protein D6830_03825 [Ignavibacteria bacterium]|nr:MAG: hypothetical protein D6830_03825 [Ignavibacteria bacterium]
MNKTRIENAWICSVNGSNVKPFFGDIIVENGVITATVKKSFKNYLKFEHKAHKNAYDAKGRVVTVPLVNFHDHFYSRLAKGLNIKGSTEDFHSILKNLWWKLDRALTDQMISASAKMSVAEAIKSGVTYIFDHHASPSYIKNSLDIIASEITGADIRGVLCFEVSDRNGSKLSQESMNENRRFAEKIDNNDLNAMVGLHASFTVSDDTLDEAHDLCNEYGLGIHIHLCEDALDRAISKEVSGSFPVDRLIHANLLNEKSILAHGIYLTAKDLDKIDEGGAAVAFNVDSNMNNSVGTPDFFAYNEAIPMLMGTDGMHGNAGKSLKNTFLLMRASGMDFDTSFHLIRKIYFDQIFFVRRYFPDYPSLKKGDRADFVIWDYVPPTPVTSSNFFGHYLYGILERQPDSVISKGKFILQNKQLLNINEDENNKFIYEQGEKLFRKFSRMK